MAIPDRILAFLQDQDAEYNHTRHPSTYTARELAHTDNFWEGLTEIEPGAIKKLAAIADERRWEVLFITSRPRSTRTTLALAPLPPMNGE